MRKRNRRSLTTYNWPLSRTTKPQTTVHCPLTTLMPVTTQVRVRYAETDQMGIVYYANYLVWFEIGRVELLRSLGLAYSQLETDHSAFCRWWKPPAATVTRPLRRRIIIETRPPCSAARSSSSPTASSARALKAKRTSS